MPWAKEWTIVQPDQQVQGLAPLTLPAQTKTLTPTRKRISVDQVAGAPPNSPNTTPTTPNMLGRFSSLRHRHNYKNYKHRLKSWPKHKSELLPKPKPHKLLSHTL